MIRAPRPVGARGAPEFGHRHHGGPIPDRPQPPLQRKDGGGKIGQRPGQPAPLRGMGVEPTQRERRDPRLLAQTVGGKAGDFLDPAGARGPGHAVGHRLHHPGGVLGLCTLPRPGGKAGLR